MVLQQQTDAKVWGAADPGEEVTVAFRGRKAGVTADPNGRWLVTVASGEGGGPVSPIRSATICRNTARFRSV